MEGAARPGHFDGVGTVVEELFLTSRTRQCLFWRKDFQQLKIIEKLVDILNLNIKIHGVKIHREESGLAMSSSNMRLSDTEKKASSVIYKTLKKVNDWFRVVSIPEIKKGLKKFSNKTR
jgi:pantoate--beta-alanine ligase